MVPVPAQKACRRQRAVVGIRVVSVQDDVALAQLGIGRRVAKYGRLVGEIALA